MTIRLKAANDVAQPELDSLRTKGQDLANAEDWAGLLALRPDLETDSDFWPDLWGPACAIAGRKLGQPGATELLEELVAAGFSQPELYDGKLEAAFADDPRWPQIEARMATDDAPPPLALTEWPVLTPSAPHLSRRLEHGPEALYPDLSELGIESVLDDHQPAIRLFGAHPFARGFTADGTYLADDILRLEDAPGEHQVALAVRTNYCALTPRILRYTVA